MLRNSITRPPSILTNLKVNTRILRRKKRNRLRGQQNCATGNHDIDDFPLFLGYFDRFTQFLGSSRSVSTQPLKFVLERDEDPDSLINMRKKGK